MAATENIDRTAARQRRIRAVVAREAGVLAHLERQAIEAGLEQPTIDAIRTAHEALASRGAVTPFVPKRREEAA